MHSTGTRKRAAKIRKNHARKLLLQRSAPQSNPSNKARFTKADFEAALKKIIRKV
jgi:hypothetical protein